jgi:hypothetical protein
MSPLGPTEEYKSSGEVGLLPLDSRVDQLKLNHAFDILNDHAPGYMEKPH